MEKEAISNFVGKKVKLVQFPKFVLYGNIKKVYNDCLLFETEQGTSIINFSGIKEISDIIHGGD